MATPEEIPIDGRAQRSERSREAIVVAMLDLIGEGSLSPTAQQVAERAEVGVRTVFRHFSDMDTLFVTMSEHLNEQVAVFLVDDIQTGPLSERLQSLVERRAAAFEKLAPYWRSSTLQRARSPFLQGQNEADMRALRRDLRRSIPEVESADPEIGDALDMALSFEAFNRLRADQRLGARRAAAAVRAIALGLASRL